MCLISGAAGLATLATVAGTAFSAYSAVQQGNAQAQSYETQAKFAERQRQIEDETGRYERARLQDRNDRIIDRSAGQFLSSGIALEGSATDVLEDSAAEASLDEQAILYGSQIQKDNLTFEAGLARANAGSARSAGKINALSAVIGGVGQLANQFASPAQSSRGFSQRRSRQNRAFNSNRTFIRNPYQ